jgi:iron(III) transport system ATP-binding protein
MLHCESITKTFQAHGGQPVRALDGVSLEVEEGAMFTLLGASGSGKTTMLRSVAGLERPDSGRITIGGVPVYDSAARIVLPANRRKLGMVFQSYAIWPHMSVFDNVAYPLRVRGDKRASIRTAVHDVLATMHMEHLADRSATALSGGQQQRLALARAVVARPRLLLLDEPLSNLDAKLRESMRFELKRLQRDLGITTLYVTHDQDEALGLSDEIALMRHGQIVQQGPPAEIYFRPATPYVADFIGSANLIGGVALDSDGTHARVSLGEGLELRGVARAAITPGSAVTIAIRPEAIQIGAAGGALPAAPDANVRRGSLRSSVFLGDRTDFLVGLGGVELRIRRPGAVLDLMDAREVDLVIDLEACLIYPEALSGRDQAVSPGMLSGAAAGGDTAQAVLPLTNVG